jgi:hypothetical protein
MVTIKRISKRSFGEGRIGTVRALLHDRRLLLADAGEAFLDPARKLLLPAKLDVDTGLPAEAAGLEMGEAESPGAR